MHRDSDSINPTKHTDELKDLCWEKIRLKVLERDERTCQVCFHTESQLKVHLKYLLHGQDPWDYPLEAFSTLCEKCYTEEGENRPVAEHALMWALQEKGFYAADVQYLADGVRKMVLLHSHEIVANAYKWALETPEIQRWLLDHYLEAMQQGTGGTELSAANAG